MSAKAIYVHIPFCINICAYCDFTKFLYHHSYVEPYINQLVNQIDATKEREIETIYIGGGTPTCLPLNLLEKVLISLSKFSNKVKEYTIESNVENINIDLIDLLKKYGVNRISIGVQSFNEKHLKYMKRKHRLEDVKGKIKLLQENDFSNISIDLIYGLPNQTFDEWVEDLKIAMSLNIKHISLYSLTIEEHTLFYINKEKEASEDTLEKFYNYAYKLLQENNFYRYEISNFACSKEYESKHNLVYWNDQEYLGFGLGAAGYEGNIRYNNTKSLQRYIKNYNLRDEEIIDEYNHKEEYIMLHLRTKYGISISNYNDTFNEDFKIKFNDAIKYCLKNDLIEFINDDIIKVKESKFYILNQIILKFISYI